MGLRSETGKENQWVRPRLRSRSLPGETPLGYPFRRRSEAVLVGCGDKGAKEGMRLEGLGLELGVELAAEEEGVTGNLDDLHVGRIRSGAGNTQAGSGKEGLIFAVEFVTMAMAFADLGRFVGAGRD